MRSRRAAERITRPLNCGVRRHVKPVSTKACLRSVGVAGTAIFATVFAFTYSVPGWVETFASDFIESEVTKEIDSRIDSFEVAAGDSAVSQLAAALYQQNQREIERLKEALKVGVHEKTATVLAQIRDLDCECRDKYAQLLKSGFQFDIALLQAANDRIVEFIQATYMEIVRVFTGVNASVFLLLLLVSFLKPQAIAQLFVPGVLLTLATVVSAYLYVFEQNWLLTIIYGDYVGLMYLAYLGMVFLALCDVVLNRARVTTKIANASLQAVGSAVTLTPC
jgi:hypothetical protein